MKIALLSMQHVLNYGSVLQAYSLQEMIRNITGENVVFINLDNPPHIDVNMPIKDEDDYASQKAIYRPRNIILKKVINKIKNKIFIQNVRKFQTKYFSVENIKSGNKFDLLIEGSDEVFKCARRLNLYMYGGIDCSKRLITYAAACGSAKIEGIPEESIKIVKNTMKHFDAMSVRDAHTEEYVKALGCSCIEHHLDPVLVGNLYKRECKPVKLKNYIVVYAYAERIRSEYEVKAIQAFAKKKNLKTVAIGAPQSWCDVYIPAEPFRILDYFHYADYVITDTFHGTVFSIITNSKFSTITRKSNAYKIEGLLNDLSISDRVIKDIQNLEEHAAQDIDWSAINSILERERMRSLEYLKNQINALNEEVI